jgi:hypothetical protein
MEAKLKAVSNSVSKFGYSASVNHFHDESNSADLIKNIILLTDIEHPESLPFLS